MKIDPILPDPEAVSAEELQVALEMIKKAKRPYVFVAAELSLPMPAKRFEAL